MSGVSWRRLDCVRLTEHAVVFSSSAGDESSSDVSSAAAHVEAAGLDGCVLVDRSVEHVEDTNRLLMIAGAMQRDEETLRTEC